MNKSKLVARKYIFILPVAIILLAIFLIDSAQAIPVFARRHSLSCAMCHVGIPKLNSFGEVFASNGYQLPGQDIKDQTVDTGDDKLLLLKDLPLAVRADTFLRARNDSDTHTDIEAPFVLKILSSAPLKEDISYYFYFLFDERGDVAGVEDAFIYFNDMVKDTELDFRIGQFQVTDILFPREQRLTFQDYTSFVTSISDSGFKLTYDRIAELSYGFDVGEDAGIGLTAAVANGNGIGVAGNDRNFDSDNFKNFYGRVSVDAFGQRVGFYGYRGKENNAAGVRNDFFRFGPDINFFIFDDLNLWGSLLYGEDDNPTFSAAAPQTMESWGTLVGVTYPFMDDWIFSILYNGVVVQQKPEAEAQTLTANATYFIMRNLKVMAEFTGDLMSISPSHPEKTHTGVLGLVLAF